MRSAALREVTRAGWSAVTSSRTGSVRRELGRDLTFVVAVTLVAIAVIAPGWSGSGPTIADMQLAGNIAAVMMATIGLNLLAGYAGQPSLGQGAFYAVGAYVSAYLMLNLSVPPLLAMAGAVLASAALGAAVAVGSMRLRGPQLAMVTLVLAIGVERVLVQVNGLGRLDGYPNIQQHDTSTLEPISVFGTTLHPPMIAGVSPTVLLPIAILLIVVLFLYRNLARSAWGRALRAVHENELLAAHLGVNVFYRKVAVFTVAAALGGLGGVVYAQVFGHLQPESFVFFLSITMLLMVVLGGSGTILGPVVGTVFIMWLQESDALAWITEQQQEYVSDRWFLSTPGIIGLLLIVTLALLPRGVVGTVRLRLTDRTRPAPAGAGAPGEGAVVAAPAPAPVAAVGPERSAPTDAGPVLLQVQGVTKKFGELVAVNEMTLDVRPGTIHAVIGPNGAGKSTLANLITGVYAPSDGTITFGGDEIAGKRSHQIARLGVARTFQTPKLFLDATVLDNVKAGFVDTGRLGFWRAAVKPPSEYRRAVEVEHEALRLLARFGLDVVADQTAGNLPYGQQRALEIARALASRPRLLVLDEPAAGLNPSEGAALAEILRSLRADGLGMILVEHDMDLISAVADVATCMEQGARLAAGRPADVLTDPRVVAAYLGSVEDETDTVEV